jgi:hypothetical protein
MKIYLALTATVFGLLVVLHLWRMIAESTSLAKDPWFILLTVISAALCFWSVRLLVVQRRRS